MKAHARWIAAAAALVVVAIGATLVVTNGDDEGRISLPFGLDEASSAEASSTAAETTVADTLSRLKDDPAPPESLFASEGEPDPSTDSAYDAYLTATEEVVVDNSEALRALGSTVLSAYIEGRADALASNLAEDESLTLEDAEAMLTRYPNITEGSLGTNVNVFAVGNVTLYVYYLDVIWLDSDLRSAHAVEIPLRFVNDSWCLSGVTPAAGDTRFVQSVTLR